jgi:two-component system LytT family response regulator
MLKCIIADDEPNAVALLELLISEATDWQVVAKCYNGLEALQVVKAHKVDLIFLDINMPLLDGMELAALLPSEIKIVFTTAYSEHAAESYLVNALDYVLKPITLKRFLTMQQKTESWFARYDALQAGIAVQPVVAVQPAADHLFVKTGKSLQKVLLQDILYVEGEKEYVKLVTTNLSLLVYRRMKVLEEQLSHPFIRVHNSFIVNLEKMEKFTDNHILIAGQRIPVSDKYRERLVQYLNHKLF